MDRFFHVTEKGSTIRTEIMAGITTFMAMAYILMVNAGMFSARRHRRELWRYLYGHRHFRRHRHSPHRSAV